MCIIIEQYREDQIYIELYILSAFECISSIKHFMLINKLNIEEFHMASNDDLTLYLQLSDIYIYIYAHLICVDIGHVKTR